jgi:DNA-directed RNA polymerase subunit N (RpoN/RPB10)
MTSYILSPECGKDLGCLTKAANLLKYKHNERCLESQDGKIDPSCVELKPDVLKPIGYIMDFLGIKKICCRMRILGDVDFDNIEKTYA